MMNWDSLRFFLALARAATPGQAAKTLRVDESTIRRRVAALEKEIGATLFDKINGAMRLTREGTELFNSAEAMEQTLERSVMAISGSDSSITGVVRVGSPHGLGSFILAPALARLQRLHPGLEVELMTFTSTADLSWRDVDLAVVHKRPDTGEHRLRKLTPLSLRLYTARSYLDQHGPITTIADLTPHPFVGYLEFTDFVDTLSGLTKLGIRPQFRSSNIVAQAQAAQAGAGIALLPDYVVSPDMDLVPVLPEQVVFPLELWLLIHADAARLARIRKVAETLVDALR